MKFLILLLISFTANANYIKESDLNKCDGITVHTKLQKCGEDCIKLPQDYNCNYGKIIPQTQMKQEVEACTDESDCQAKLEAKICEKGEAIKNLDLLEVYCTWVRARHVGIDEAKKAAHDAQKALKEQEKLDQKAEKDALKAKKWKSLSDNEKDRVIEMLLEKI